MKLDVFGTRVQVVAGPSGWSVYYLGEDGKRRAAKDIVVPSTLRRHEVEQYIADICHEWATPEYPDVTRLG